MALITPEFLQQWRQLLASVFPRHVLTPVSNLQQSHSQHVGSKGPPALKPGAEAWLSLEPEFLQLKRWFTASNNAYVAGHNPCISLAPRFSEGAVTNRFRL